MREPDAKERDELAQAHTELVAMGNRIVSLP